MTLKQIVKQIKLLLRQGDKPRFSDDDVKRWIEQVKKDSPNWISQ